MIVVALGPFAILLLVFVQTYHWMMDGLIKSLNILYPLAVHIFKSIKTQKMQYGYILFPLRNGSSLVG